MTADMVRDGRWGIRQVDGDSAAAGRFAVYEVYDRNAPRRVTT